MDKAVIASLIATIMAVAALGITTWLSFRFNGAVRAQEQAVLDGYKGAEGHSLQLEHDVATARERVSTLEQEVATARQQAAALEQQVTAARDKAATVEQEASTARERAEAFGQAARDANERAARADRETAEATAKERAMELDAAEIRQRLAALGQQVRKAAEQAPKPAEQATTPAEQATKPAESPAETAAPSGDKPSSLVVESLRRYAGTKAAVFVVDRVTDAPAAGAEISTDLTDAGWEPQTWKWTGVAGIFGVVVLVREGSDAATNDAASTLVEQLRANAFSASKGDWPADWRLYRGTLDGPKAPAPTDAPIRIVIGVKPR